MTDATGAPAADAVTEPVETDEVTTTLKEQGIGDDVIAKIKDELGVVTVDDLAVLNEADLMMAGLKPVQARKLLATFAPKATVVDDETLDVLPASLDDASWLEALKTGGVLKVDQSTVISAIKVALAARVGMFDIPKKLVVAMEQFTEVTEEPIDPVYYKVRAQLTRRNYGELFSVIEGLDGNYVTDARKTELLARINTYLWPAITDYYSQLKSWYDTWLQGAANPALLIQALAGAKSGMAMPSGAMQAPDTSSLRDHGDALNDAANKVFAGTGAQIASALAFDAMTIKKQLEDTRLPALIGAANRELMLKQLGIAVSATYPRLETNLTRFVLSALQAKDQPAGLEEYNYFQAMYLLGSQIDWSQIGASKDQGYTGIGGRNNGRL
ncbi:MAG TPA: hypothetical protein VIM31_00335 [Candidatus Microsaccharimonas sp.]|jgi:hypothetical protein